MSIYLSTSSTLIKNTQVSVGFNIGTEKALTMVVAAAEKSKLL